MNIAEILGQAIQKPQSVAQGGMIGVLKMLGMDSPEVDPNANAETQRIQELIGGISNPLDGLKAGWENSIRPSDAFRMNGYGENMADKIGMNVADVALDPMLALGGLSKGAAAAGKLGKASKYVDAATTTGKLAEGATRGQKIAQGARQAYQGTLAMGDPISGLGAGFLMRQAENRLLPAISAKLATKAVGNSVDDFVDAANPDDAIVKALGMGEQPMSRPEILASRISGELGPGPNVTPMGGPAIPMGPPQAPTPRPTAFLPSNATAKQQPLTGMLEESMATRPELPAGPRIGTTSDPDYATQISALLGKRGNTAMGEGERLDSLLRGIMESGRAGTGRFTNEQQRQLIERLTQDPESLRYLAGQVRYPK